MVFWKRRRWFTVLAGAIILAPLGVVALIGALWVEHRFATTLPPPTGPYNVGRVHDVWSDPPESPAAPQMIVWIWYPAAGHPDAGKTSRFLPPELSAAVMRQQDWLLGNVLTRDLSKVRAHAIDDAPLAPEPHTFPVLLLRGGASAPVWNYTTLAENLASHGYVVVGFDIPYRTKTVLMANGTVATRTPENDPETAAERHDDATIQRLIDAWARDLSRALDHLARLNTSEPMGRFHGRLDLDRVGAFGHSFGGTEVAQFCVSDPRCRAGVDIDGGMFGSAAKTTISQPFMILLGDHHRENGPDSAAIMRDIEAVYARLPAATRKRITIPDANHFFFSDDAALLKSRLIINALRFFGIVKIDGPRQLALTANAVQSFFDAALPEKTTTRHASTTDR